MKNPQFLSNFTHTFRNLSIHGKVYPWKYKLNWTKIVDFLLIALYFQDSKLGWTGLYLFANLTHLQIQQFFSSCKISDFLQCQKSLERNIVANKIDEK